MEMQLTVCISNASVRRVAAGLLHRHEYNLRPVNPHRLLRYAELVEELELLLNASTVHSVGHEMSNFVPPRITRTCAGSRWRPRPSYTELGAPPQAWPA